MNFAGVDVDPDPVWIVSEVENQSTDRKRRCAERIKEEPRFAFPDIS